MDVDNTIEFILEQQARTEIVLDRVSERHYRTEALLQEGIYINPVLRPAAAQNLLRISCTAAHTETHVDRLVTTLSRLAAQLGIA